ncbi:MAG: hypothetical protein ABH983_02785 [Candidatus Micrarchaeota archaeon]
MSSEEFEAAIESAKKLEKKILEYEPFDGEVEIEKSLDLEPSEYIDLTFNDLANEYERSQKILSTRKLGIYASEEKVQVSVESAEVETKLREMTKRTLTQAEEVAAEPSIELEAPPQAPVKESEPSLDIEIEREMPPEIEFEKPEPIKEDISTSKTRVEPVIKETPEPTPRFKEPVISPETPREEPEMTNGKKPVPPALREKPVDAADERYQKMENQIRTMLGEKPDELSLKKKMLELTKQLFKEKSHNKRAEIKVQITVLKNMLIRAKSGKSMVSKGKKDETYANLFDTLTTSQQAENAQTKDTVIDSYNAKINEIKKKFYSDLSNADDKIKRKKIYEGFVFSVTQIIEQLPDTIKEQREYNKNKHLEELGKLRESAANDKKTLAKVEEKIEQVEQHYDKQFNSIKRILGQEIETLIEVTGTEIFKKPEENTDDKEVKVHEVVKEINNIDEGTLLYFLHTNDSEYYRGYERKQISKAEALCRAKALMAKEKGMSSATVKKYFNQVDE